MVLTIRKLSSAPNTQRSRMSVRCCNFLLDFARVRGLYLLLKIVLLNVCFIYTNKHVGHHDDHDE